MITSGDGSHFDDRAPPDLVEFLADRSSSVSIDLAELDWVDWPSWFGPVPPTIGIRPGTSSTAVPLDVGTARASASGALRLIAVNGTFSVECRGLPSNAT